MGCLSSQVERRSLSPLGSITIAPKWARSVSLPRRPPLGDGLARAGGADHEPRVGAPGAARRTGRSPCASVRRSRAAASPAPARRAVLRAARRRHGTSSQAASVRGVRAVEEGAVAADPAPPGRSAAGDAGATPADSAPRPIGRAAMVKGVRRAGRSRLRPGPRSSSSAGGGGASAARQSRPTSARHSKALSGDRREAAGRASSSCVGRRLGRGMCRDERGHQPLLLFMPPPSRRWRWRPVGDRLDGWTGRGAAVALFRTPGRVVAGARRGRLAVRAATRVGVLAEARGSRGRSTEISLRVRPRGAAPRARAWR